MYLSHLAAGFEKPSQINEEGEIIIALRILILRLSLFGDFPMHNDV